MVTPGWRIGRAGSRTYSAGPVLPLRVGTSIRENPGYPVSPNYPDILRE
jgi:hypothetical protein